MKRNYKISLNSIKKKIKVKQFPNIFNQNKINPILMQMLRMILNSLSLKKTKYQKKFRSINQEIQAQVIKQRN